MDYTLPQILQNLNPSSRLGKEPLPNPGHDVPGRPSLRSGVALLAFAALSSPFTLLHAHTPAPLPTDPTVVHGSAAFNTIGDHMTVTSSPGTILDWQSFSIGADHGVYFRQPDAASQVLNRVIGGDPSQILGSLGSNGGVWLINSHGVLFGQNARVDVAGLVTSTLDISNIDFLAGRYNFVSAGGHAGQVANQGDIRTSFGGRVWLLGDHVRNEGIIQTPGGHIVLAAGKSLELVDSGAPNVIVRVTAPENEVANLGSLVSASGGSVDLHASIVNQQGIVRADSVGTDAAGRIVLKASHMLTLGDNSKTSADGKQGGQIIVEAGEGGAQVTGNVSAIGMSNGGGQIRILGSHIDLYDQAIVDASGASGGGEVLVGGDTSGKNPMIPHAQSTYIGRNVTLSANAQASGDGGRIIVWSDAATRVYGMLEARGGMKSGNGGFIETSGGWLDARPGIIDVKSATGASGTWLLDPHDIVIANSQNVNVDEPQPGQFTSVGDTSMIDAALLSQRLSEGTNVMIQTGNGGTQPGNITVSANITESSGNNPSSLTLSAHNDIIVNPAVSIFSAANPMGVTFISDSDGNGAGGIEMQGGSSIATNGGDITFKGGGAEARAFGSFAGINITSATLDAGSGKIDFSGSGLDNGGRGVSISGGSLTADTITINGVAPTTNQQTAGVLVTNSSSIDGRMISINGLTNSVELGSPGGKWWSSLIDGQSVVRASSNGEILIQGSDGFAGMEGSQIEAAGNSPIKFSGRWIDIISGTIGGSAGDNGGYAGDITFTGERINLERRNNDTGPTISTSGSVALLPAMQGGDLGVRLQDPVFDANIGQILIGDSTTGNLSYSNSNGLAPSDGPISVQSPVFLQSTGTTTFQSDSGISSSASGDAIKLVTGNFVNLSGAAALSTSNGQGRWSVHSTDPSNDTIGDLAYSFRQYNATPATQPAQSGNGLFYSSPLDLGGKISRTYDGTTTALLDSTTLDFTNIPSGYNLSVQQAGNGLFPDKNVGVGKPINTDCPAPCAQPVFSVTDNFNKPVFGETFTFKGDVTPATLTYSADPLQAVAGGPIGGLSGVVSGLKATDTLPGATDGTLSWTTVAGASSLPGVYAVNGGGLTSANYDLVQAPGNAAALTLLDGHSPNISPPAAQDTVHTAVQSINVAMLGAFPILDWVTIGYLVDMTSKAPNFGRLDLSRMSRADMQQLIDLRREFKEKLFADAIYKLEQDPGLANVRPCPSLADINTGLCRITDAQRLELASKAAAEESHRGLRRTKVARLPQIERKFVVLFGIDRYADKTIPPLENAVFDAETLGKLFADKLGYESRVVRNATKADIVRTLNQLSAEMKPHDSVIIYYAGHGYRNDKTIGGYWIPSDASVTDPSTWISNTDVSGMLAEISANQIVMIADSCYSGNFAEQKFRAQASLGADELLARRTVVMMSSGGDEPVADEGRGGHSIFAWDLMQALRNVDNWRPGTNIFEEVRREVMRSFPQTPQYGAIKSAGHQAGGDYLFEFRQLE